MNEPTKKTKQELDDQTEWEWQIKMDKIYQNHDMCGEREDEGEEE